jgi:hypothetical protein
MKLLTYCNKWDRELPFLLDSIEGKIPYECHIVSGEFTWAKIVDWQLEVTRKYSEEDLILVDAYDTLFVGDVEKLEDLIRRENLVYCADKHCWPDSSRASSYPDQPASPWRYLNGGVMVGKGWAIHGALHWGTSYSPIKPMREGLNIYHQDNDQRLWTDVYLQGYGSLDSQCEIFQNLSDIKDSDFRLKRGRFYNTVTKTYPQFLHAAAHTWRLIPKELYGAA